ncbi:MAG: DUF4423 domain-containing protein [Oligoflexales bacterium]
MNIYAQTDYRKILKEVVSERKRLDRTSNFQRLAEVARVPKSYVSRVMGGGAEFSNDQLDAVCNYLGFNDDETSYMLLLLDHSRTGVVQRKKKLGRKIADIQATHLETKKHLKTSVLSAEVSSLHEYYLDPMIQIVHVCLALEKYRKSVQRLESDLNLPSGRLGEILANLERIGVIAMSAKGIEIIERSLHLPPQSPLYKSWRSVIRVMGVNQMLKIPEKDSYAFSGVFSANRRIKNQIQSKFLAFLEEAQKLVMEDGAAEDVYQLNFDLFPWTPQS